MMSVCPSVSLSLKISIITEPIGLYSSKNIPTGPVVVFGYFLWGLHTLNPKSLGTKPLEAWGEAAILINRDI